MAQHKWCLCNVCRWKNKNLSGGLKQNSTVGKHWLGLLVHRKHQCSAPFQVSAILAPVHLCRGSFSAPSPGRAYSPLCTAEPGPPLCVHSPVQEREQLSTTQVKERKLSGIQTHTHTHTQIDNTFTDQILHFHFVTGKATMTISRTGLLSSSSHV